MFVHIPFQSRGCHPEPGEGSKRNDISRRVLAFLVFVLVAVLAPAAGRIEISWPSPNTAWEKGQGYEAWVQPTVSGEPTSGLFGSVRSNGTQFHEGLDIKPVGRDRR